MDYGFWMPIVIILIIIGSYYIGQKLKYLIKVNNKFLKILYWIILYSLIFIIILKRTVISVFVIYCLFLYGFFDIAYYFVKKCKFMKLKKVLQKIYLKGGIVLILSSIILVLGVYNVSNPKVINYNIKIDKSIKSTNIVFVSDIHLGTVQNSFTIEHLVSEINSLNPDVFILGGDIFDENTKTEDKNKAYKELGKIKTKYGSYYIEGNHDILTTSVKNNFEKNNITVLDDKAKLINNNYYLVGRKDYRRIKLGKGRKTLKELTKKLDDNIPIVVIDHQPQTKEAVALKTELQISGHTHGGQFFPGNLFIKKGYSKTEDTQIVVSRGYGAWTFAARTVGRSEISKIKISN